MNLVEDLLDVSRTMKGKLQLEVGPTPATAAFCREPRKREGAADGATQKIEVFQGSSTNR